MNILFLHNFFPGQYTHLAAALAANPAHRVVFASVQGDGSLAGVERRSYGAARPVRDSAHPYLRWMEGAVLTGQAVYRLCHGLKQDGFVPDVVCAHSGWGPALYVKEIFPACRLVGYFEWYYGSRDSDADFLGQALSADESCRLHTRNAAVLLDLAACDVALTPTRFQRDRFPQKLRPLLTTMHDGIDTDWFRPDVPVEAEIVTYATRGMEPYRGFPQFMRAAAMLLRRRPNCRVVIAGDDRVVYGSRLGAGESWRQRMLAELPDLDLGRVHFTGTLPPDQYRRLLQSSAVHVYLTVPFVLSWSLLEAMACGCPLVASDTEPVREVATNGLNGLLVDFFSPEAIAGKIEILLEDRAKANARGRAARECVMENYGLRTLLPRQMELVVGG